ncbi:hypothetical protein J8J14_07090 [Roseomonas sp. SSH11]|uniref:General secretion pathway protein M n=1 Tax=Pararoseomonas baculiformis TaxID=2820812 RepID=A0ABS4AC16_9PROT|nr:type II secretion system protein GspM [Pararoseomonas baculiformis]MBP0444544.1 hypothetical protein [Pararoseomonas baculiformis]
MMTNLSLPVRRLLALALLSLPPLLLWSVLIGPWLDQRAALSARMADALMIEARSLALAARKPAIEAEGESLRQALSGVVDPLPGGSYALAGAELQRRLREAAGRQRAPVSSVETLLEGRAGPGMVGVRGRLQTDAEGLQRLLAELEAGRALLQVHSLTLATMGSGARRVLDVQVELRAPRQEEATR